MKFNRLLSIFAFVSVGTLALTGCSGTEGTGDDGEAEDVEANASQSGPQGVIEAFSAGSGDARQHYFHLVSNNHKIVLQSEGYGRTDGRDNGIEALKKNGVLVKAETRGFGVLKTPDPGKKLPIGTRPGGAGYELRASQSEDAKFNKKPYFVIKGGNGEVLAISELYSDLTAAKAGMLAASRVINSVRRAQAARLQERNPEIAIFKGEDGQTYWHLRAKNGEITLQSEGYKGDGADRNAGGGAAALVRAVLEGGIFEKRTAGNEQTYFVVKAVGNSEIVATSELYVKKQGAENAIDSVSASFKQPGAKCTTLEGVSASACDAVNAAIAQRPEAQ